MKSMATPGNIGVQGLIYKGDCYDNIIDISVMIQ